MLTLLDSIFRWNDDAPMLFAIIGQTLPIRHGFFKVKINAADWKSAHWDESFWFSQQTQITSCLPSSMTNSSEIRLYE